MSGDLNYHACRLVLMKADKPLFIQLLCNQSVLQNCTIIRLFRLLKLLPAGVVVDLSLLLLLLFL